MVAGLRHSSLSFLPLLILAILMVAGPAIVSAHAPLSAGSGEGISGATLIPNPEKSYVIYTELNREGAPHYYRFPMEEGQILNGSLQVPGPASPVPVLVILGPALESAGDIPPSIDVPAGSGALLVRGAPIGTPSYEPFTPQPVYEAARFNLTVPQSGEYYLAVTGQAGTRYGLAPGFREEFTAAEWLLVPWSVIRIHLWEGQSPVWVFAPMGIVLVGGVALAVRYRNEGSISGDPVRWLILLAGLLFLGGAAMTGFQIIHAVQVTGYSSGILLTFLLLIGPILMGLFAVRLGARASDPGHPLRNGITMAVIGVLGLLLWGGFFIGPILALVAGAILLLRPSQSFHIPFSLD